MFFTGFPHGEVATFPEASEASEATTREAVPCSRSQRRFV